MKHQCAGIRKTWPWKGYPCGSVAQYERNGKWWCKNHLPLNEMEKRLEEKLNKERAAYCANECPVGLESEGGTPNCGPCPWEGFEEDD